MRRWIATVSLLVASLVLFQTTVAAADAPQKTSSPKKAPMTQPTSINASTNLAASLPAVPPAPQPAPGLETIYLAGGCFWGMEEILRKIPGVRETQSGYTGGWLPNPKYDDTHDSKSGHAESVKVVFDPKTLSLEELLEKWFFRMHDPTTLNRQGNDAGSQYRSAIFTFNETQKTTAETVKARVNASGKWRRPVVTEIATASIWYSAEGYHQKYLVKNPGGYTCHFMRD
ncbi:MAG: peptide-methionine (S)-S-oxide reductase [Pedosphaera sp.]|nr:peptide-methionine (S)-S-oxide reductase [Pedosphaera sp.]